MRATRWLVNCSIYLAVYAQYFYYFRQVKSSQVAFNKKAMTIALHVHNVQTIHKSKYKNYETRNTMSILYTMSREIVNCAN